MIANYSPFRETALRYIAKIIETKYKNQLDETNTSDLNSVYDAFWPGKRNIRNFLHRAGCEDFTARVPENEYTYWSLVKAQSETRPDGRNKIFKIIEQLCDPEEYYDDPETRDGVIEQINKLLHQYKFTISEIGTVIPYTGLQQALAQYGTHQDNDGTVTGREERKKNAPTKAERLQKSISQQDLKNYIRIWVKKDRKIDSHLGEIAIGKLLGEGGNALVFESPFAGGTAIKFLAESISSPPSTRYARFLDEYRNLIKLVPTAAIVPLYHFGIQDMNGEHIPFIVMENCDKTLHDVYQSGKLASALEFQHLLDRLLEILEVIHDAGIVHRDIKPQNILMRRNNTWVLGDFGIAWFDPELHNKLAVTKKNDRLANFEFSAPEQIKRRAYEKPTPSMDFYALGQILYYCVTGLTMRGSGCPRLSQIAPELGTNEPLIDRLLRLKPQERFQSVIEIRQFLEQILNTEDHSDSGLRVKYQSYLDKFDLALRSAMPGAYEYVQAKNKVEIDRVMVSLAKYREECNLWWFRAFSNNPVRALEKLSDDIWLVDNYECEIIDLWLYRHGAKYTHQYAIIQLAPRHSFGVYASHHPEMEDEEVGYFKGSYMTRAEYDDGYATIDGEVIKLDGTEEVRFRNL